MIFHFVVLGLFCDLYIASEIPLESPAGPQPVLKPLEISRSLKRPTLLTLIQTITISKSRFLVKSNVF